MAYVHTKDVCEEGSLLMNRQFSRFLTIVITTLGIVALVSLIHAFADTGKGAMAQTPPELVCERDVVFVLDNSTSIAEAGPETWSHLRRFTLDVAEAIAIAPDGVHAGALKFATDTEVLINLTDDTARFTSALDQATFRGGRTNTARAIGRAIDMLDRQGRPEVVGTIVLVSDGQQNEPGDPFAEAQLARDHGYHLVIVGIGSIDRTFFEELAGGTSPIYCATSADLPNVIDETSIDICHGPQPTPSPCVLTPTQATAVPGMTQTPVPEPSATALPAPSGTPTPAPAPAPIKPTGEPAAVHLDYFWVSHKQMGGYTLQWQTSLQIDTWSFHILVSRSTDPTASREPIGAVVLAQDGRLGATYTVSVELPDAPDEQWVFWLEEVELDGNSIVYGPAAWVDNPMNTVRVFCPYVAD